MTFGTTLVENGKTPNNVGGQPCEKIYGPTRENCSWRIKMNQEMYNKFKYPDTVTVIEVRRS